jgi:hypothetical protein
MAELLALQNWNDLLLGPDVKRRVRDMNDGMGEIVGYSEGASRLLLSLNSSVCYALNERGLFDRLAVQARKVEREVAYY